jgi:hypothetical protein
MLVIESARRVATDLARLPWLSRAGLVLMVAAAVGDVAIHVALGERGAHQHDLGPEHIAHLLGVAGMVVVLAGVAMFGARRSHRSTGDTNHAHR